MASTLVDSLLHPVELVSLVRFLLSPDPAAGYSKEPKDEADTYAWCYYFLNMTSRSFARVIQTLNEELRHPVCIFYLVLRGLDTVEDDMTLDLPRKVEILGSFHKLIYQKGWTFDENGPNEKDRMLLVRFDTVITEFLKLDAKYQTVIADICQRMAKGMIDFVSGKTVETLDDYNLYTHYVAGLVGLGLTDLFLASNLEPDLAALSEEHRYRLANSMGLFLQKVNITRDFTEDLLDGRKFWPRDIYSNYASSLEELPTKPEMARACLNNMCADAMTLIPDCLEYLSLLREPSVFAFCAIPQVCELKRFSSARLTISFPQVMAIATFDLVFDNPALFHMPLLKIRKGTAAQMMLESGDMGNVVRTFSYYVSSIRAKNLVVRRRAGPEVKAGVCDRIDRSCDDADRCSKALQEKLGESWSWLQPLRPVVVLAVGVALFTMSSG
ncbi:farnesyl-diphosphate farnesyltransferase 1 [Hyaloraphidium curvatum]|nr:farnesyl-diphosphate farnesyltransferase 1 [Hyaloraphidium curvatum]